MQSLADQIEAHIKQLLNKVTAVEVQRSELAQIFACAPSQINYVLATRFAAEQGYLVESRRGGGGYIRIIKLLLNGESGFWRLVRESVGEFISQQSGEGLIKRLCEEKLLTTREGLLLRAVIRREVISLSLPERDLVRANILKAVLNTLLRDDLNLDSSQEG